MTGVEKTLASGVALCALEFGVAFLLAPNHSWGINAYVPFGLVCFIVALVLPLALCGEISIGYRILMGVLLVVVTVAAWVGGLLASNMSILTRLF